MTKTIFGGYHKVLIDLLIDARKQSGLKQVDLGKLLGKDQTYISLIERYQRRLDVVEFYNYTKALDVNPEDIFSKFVKELSNKTDI